jgi:E3 ubiquitin-protein ligase SIAH1
MCRRALSGGYKRCFGVEHIVEGLRVPCANKDYGCSARLARYNESAHLRACQYRPFHCPAEDCTFVAGNLPALQKHFLNTHRWPSTRAYMISDMGGSVDLALVDGFNLIEIYPFTFLFKDKNPSGLVLLKVTRESYGRAVTFINILSRNSKYKTCRLKFEYEAPCSTLCWEYKCNVASNDLSASHRLSFREGCFGFVVPKSAQPLDMDTVNVAFKCWHDNV